MDKVIPFLCHRQSWDRVKAVQTGRCGAVCVCGAPSSSCSFACFNSALIIHSCVIMTVLRCCQWKGPQTQHELMQDVDFHFEHTLRRCIITFVLYETIPCGLKETTVSCSVWTTIWTITLESFWYASQQHWTAFPESSILVCGSLNPNQLLLSLPLFSWGCEDMTVVLFCHGCRWGSNSTDFRLELA